MRFRDNNYERLNIHQAPSSVAQVFSFDTESSTQINHPHIFDAKADAHVYASTTRELRAFARVFRRKSEEREAVSLDGHHHQSARQRLAANNRRKRRGDEEISVERSPTGSYSGHGGLCEWRGTNSRRRRAVAMDISFLVFFCAEFFFAFRLECARGYSPAMS